MSKLLKIMLTSIAILIVVAIGGLVVILNMDDSAEPEEMTIDEIVKYSYQTPEITTDLQDGSYVRIQFQILTDGKEAHEEVGKREFQLVNILIKELAKMDEESLKEGLTDLEQTLKDSINDVMTEGSVTDVLTINKILQ